MMVVPIRTGLSALKHGGVVRNFCRWLSGPISESGVKQLLAVLNLVMSLPTGLLWTRLSWVKTRTMSLRVLRMLAISMREAVMIPSQVVPQVRRSWVALAMIPCLEVMATIFCAIIREIMYWQVMRVMMLSTSLVTVAQQLRSMVVRVRIP